MIVRYLMAVMACLVMVATQASAQDANYPNRPIHIIVCVPAGGGVDTVTRYIAEGMEKRLGQPVVVENRSGAGGNIGAEVVFKSDPDGYTLLASQPAPITVNPLLYKHIAFDPTKFEPVAIMTIIPNVLLVREDFPAKTAQEFMAYAKANPGKINMSSPGVGSINHVLGELFNMMTGVKLVHVPYRTSQFPDLVSGQVQVTFNPLPSSLGFIKNGQLRALAVTSKERQAVLPNVPTVGETVPGYEGTAWFGLGVPKKTPKDVIATLNKAMNAGLADAKFKAKLIDLGGVPMPGSPEEFSKFIHAENAKWAKVVKFSGAKVD